MAAPLDQGLSGGRSGGDGFRVVTTSGIYLAVLYTHVECQTHVRLFSCSRKHRQALRLGACQPPLVTVAPEEEQPEFHS